MYHKKNPVDTANIFFPNSLYKMFLMDYLKRQAKYRKTYSDACDYPSRCYDNASAVHVN